MDLALGELRGWLANAGDVCSRGGRDGSGSGKPGAVDAESEIEIQVEVVEDAQDKDQEQTMVVAEAPKQSGEFIPSVHEHKLFFAVKLRNRRCDICGAQTLVEAWQCQVCGFDLCSRCYDRAVSAKTDLFWLNDDPKQGLDPAYHLCRADSSSATEQAACRTFDLEDANLSEAKLECASLFGVNLKGAFLLKANLDRADLREAHLEGANLLGAHLQEANLREAHLEGAILREAHLKEANLREAHLEGAILFDARLEKADLRDAHLENAHLDWAHLREAHLEGANLEKAHLQDANLRGAHLKEANLREAHLEKADLRKAQLEKADLREAHLEKAILVGAHLEEASLRKAHLEGAELWGAHLQKVSLLGAHLEGASLGKAHLEEANLRDAHLQGANLWGAHLEGANLRDAHLQKANLWWARLTGANLREAHLQEASLRHAHLKWVDMSSMHLKGTDLREAHLEKADLQWAHLEKADLREAHLEKADLRNAHLEGADLDKAHLEKTNLKGAHLEKADLQSAHLEKADLREAHLERANLRDAHLEGADLREAHLEKADLRGAHLEKTDLSSTSLVEADLADAWFSTKTLLLGANLQQAKVARCRVSPAHIPLRRACIPNSVSEGCCSCFRTTSLLLLKKSILSAFIGGTGAGDRNASPEGGGLRGGGASGEEDHGAEYGNLGVDGGLEDLLEDLCTSTGLSLDVEKAGQRGLRCAATRNMLFGEDSLGEDSLAQLLVTMVAQSETILKKDSSPQSDSPLVWHKFPGWGPIVFVGSGKAGSSVGACVVDNEDDDLHADVKMENVMQQISSIIVEVFRTRAQGWTANRQTVLSKELINRLENSISVIRMQRSQETDESEIPSNRIRCSLPGGRAEQTTGRFRSFSCGSCPSRISLSTVLHRISGPAKSKDVKTLDNEPQSEMAKGNSDSEQQRSTNRHRAAARLFVERTAYRRMLAFVDSLEESCLDLASKSMRAVDADLLKKHFKSVRTELRDAQLTLPSIFHFPSVDHTLRVALAFPQRTLYEQLRKLDFVLERLNEAKATPIEEKTWQDSVESWLALRDLLPQVSSQRAVRVLECVFGDAKVLDVLGRAEIFLPIDGGERTPVDLLTQLKAVLGGQMKQNFFAYVEVMEKEKVAIQHVISLQNKLFAAFSAGIVGIFFGVSNFLFRLIYEEWLA